MQYQATLDCDPAGVKMAEAKARLILRYVGDFLARQPMLSTIFDPRKRAASRELDVAIYYLLHGAENLIPSLKDKYRDKWSGFIDDILSGARPYEEATAVISIFLQQSFRNLYRDERDAIIAAIAGNNLGNPPNLLWIIGQICYFLYLADKDGKVGENLLPTWMNDMSKLFAETGKLSADQCGTYLISLATTYRDDKRKSVGTDPDGHFTIENPQ